MTIKATVWFDRRTTVFWATTYTFEPVFFESFLLPRLGEAPLNAVVLVDWLRAADALQTLTADTPWRGSRANRDYLMRGVASTDGAFHSKTYLFADATRGQLLVGSGNLGLSGIETGKELFASFDSERPDGLAAIRAWRNWMAGLVENLGDDAVSDRWRDAQRRAPWLVGPSVEERFVTNWRRPLIDVLLDGIEAPVDELHLSAPFFDRRANAVETLIERARPRLVRLVLGRDASVDGPELRRVLEASGAGIELVGLEPHTYVHGKLVGLIKGDRGRVLGGSANLSTAALLRAVTTSRHANVEAGTIADVAPEDVRAGFLPPGLEFTARRLDDLAVLEFKPDGERHFPVALRSAAWLPDGRIEISADLTLTEGLLLSSDVASAELAGLTTTAPFREDSVRLVWLSKPSGEQQSNKVAIDEPARLRQALQERGEAFERPAGVEAADLETPVGQMLARLHEACIFDFDDTPTARRMPRAADDETEDPEFWKRLAIEDLQRDPRVSHYLRVGADLTVLDGIFLDLARMRDAVPLLAHPHVLDGGEEPPATPTPRERWTPERRLQVRLFNVLERWCAALADPRLRWLDGLAPVGNYAALVGALDECWREGYLAEHRVVELVGVLLSAFVRGERRPGFCAALDEADRVRVTEILAASEAPEIAAGLVWASVRSSRRDLLDYLFAWQPALRLGTEWGVIRFTGRCAEVAEGLTGKAVDLAEMAERVAWATSYMNDDRWCELVGRELGVKNLAFVRSGYAARFGAVMAVDAATELLGDAAVVELVRRALAYRKTRGCIVEAGTNRLIIDLDQPIVAKIDGRLIETDEPVVAEDLDAMASDGASLATLISVIEGIAS